MLASIFNGEASSKKGEEHKLNIFKNVFTRVKNDVDIKVRK